MNREQRLFLQAMGTPDLPGETGTGRVIRSLSKFTGAAVEKLVGQVQGFSNDAEKPSPAKCKQETAFFIDLGSIGPQV
ncbi:hypothetical protein GJ688_16390 [Heliobacillus mobilis]|uniref:Uncharacterized protein n=1 Tax=Heliobacterium mobile TaxID=28064 RepID=A0A6I3SPB4_HELMO|nr:hypothetical protein [Heliobacterium mobile]